MTPTQRVLFVIEHMTTSFKEEIKKDFEAALNEARLDELHSVSIIKGEIVHHNGDGNMQSRDSRARDLKEGTKW